MKNVLLLVHDDPGQESRLQAALDLVRALDGHLICLGVTELPVLSGDYLDSTAQAVILADAQERDAETRRRIEARLAHEGAPWEWRAVVGTMTGAVESESRSADLIVVSSRLDSRLAPDMRSVASDVVIGSGKAVVAVPQASAGFPTGGAALIAWNGSEEAMRALESALPLLRLAERVILLEIGRPSPDMPGEEACAWLSRHGLGAELVRRDAGDRSVGRAIIDEAASASAAFIVMGAFGHSRVREALLGGVSRELLGDSPVPVVMAH